LPVETSHVDTLESVFRREFGAESRGKTVKRKNRRLHRDPAQKTNSFIK
jgi:hypothetical protein